MPFIPRLESLGFSGMAYKTSIPHRKEFNGKWDVVQSYQIIIYKYRGL
jgi:hypothetical protein